MFPKSQRVDQLASSNEEQKYQKFTKTNINMKVDIGTQTDNLMHRPFDQNKLNNANLRNQSQETTPLCQIYQNYVPQFFGYQIGCYNWYYPIPYSMPFILTSNTPQSCTYLDVIPFAATGFGPRMIQNSSYYLFPKN